MLSKLITTLAPELLNDSETETILTTIVQYEETTSSALNITEDNQKVQVALYAILIPLLASIAILLNLIVVVSSGLIVKKGTQPICTYLLLGNVAMSDLVTSIAILLGAVYPNDQRTKFMCVFQLGLIVSSTVVSIYSVGLIAVDRYLYIIHGIKYQHWVTTLRTRISIILTWILGGVVGFLPVMGWSGPYVNQQCWFISLVPPKLILMICLLGLIPILLVIVLYSIILYHAIKKVIQLRKAGQQPADDNGLRIFRGNSAINIPEDYVKSENIFRKYFKSSVTEPKAPKKSKAVIIVLLTTGSFVITWVPYFIASFLFINCDKNVTPDRCNTLQIMIASPLAILGFCNSLLNPIIYAWWHNGFRGFVQAMICKKKGSSTTPGTSSSNVDKSSRKSSSCYDNKAADIELNMVSIDLTQN